MRHEYMRYAIEVAEAGSLEAAAERLSIDPPVLSRAIREMEDGLGVPLFDRQANLTPEGRDFISRARRILRQIDGLEAMYTTRRLSISAPPSAYITEALARLSRSLGPGPVEISYRETDSRQDAGLSIIRCRAGLPVPQGEVLAEFPCVLLMSSQSPLAGLKEIRLSDLRPLIEIVSPFTQEGSRRIFASGGQFDLLAGNAETFMWSPPVPEKLLRGLVQRECADNNKRYQDILIHRNPLTELEQRFITELRACIILNQNALLPFSSFSKRKRVDMIES